MIVKYTLNDNDFTQVIEEYLNEFGPFYGFNYVTFDGVNEFKRLLKQYDNYKDKYYIEKDITPAEFKQVKNKILVILKANFIQYISNIGPNSNWSTCGMNAKELQGNKEYILNNIKIKIVNSIPYQWENGEVVYFITNNEKYITM